MRKDIIMKTEIINSIRNEVTKLEAKIYETGRDVLYYSAYIDPVTARIYTYEDASTYPEPADKSLIHLYSVKTGLGDSDEEAMEESGCTVEEYKNYCMRDADDLFEEHHGMTIEDFVEQYFE